jgi:hypothetical protein
MLLTAKRKTWLFIAAIALCGATSGLCRHLNVPLPVDICPTSSFGSWRHGHLHAGLDFSTGGITGVPVLAVDSCWVWRIRLWNSGYGKALYAQLPDGKVAVYGHLSRFVPEIEAMVEQEQDLKGSYEVELYFEPSVFRFVPGDTMAFSGETGSGPPHLHFELRSGRYDHMKMNPIPRYMDIAEPYAPEIRSLLITPLSAECSINGRHETVRVAPASSGDTLRITGEFGLSVSAVDRVQCDRVLRPVRYEARVDGRQLWRLNLDTFPFAETHLVGLLYHRSAGDIYVRLHDPYGLDLSGFDCVAPHQIGYQPELAHGYHRITLTVADAWGNKDSVSVPFIYGRLPTFRRFSLEPDSAGILVMVSSVGVDDSVELAYRSGAGEPTAVEPVGDPKMCVARIPLHEFATEIECELTSPLGLARTCTLAPSPAGPGPASFVMTTVLHNDFLEVYAQASDPPARLPSLAVYENDLVTTGILQPVASQLYRACYRPRNSEGTMTAKVTFQFGDTLVTRGEDFAFGRLMAGSTHWYVGEAYRIRLSAPGGLGPSTLVRIDDEAAVSDAASTYEGFDRTVGRIAVEPEGAFFNEQVEVVIVPRKPGVNPRAAVFAERDIPVFLSGFDSTGACVLRLRSLENLVILEDRAPPVIEVLGSLRLRPEDGKAVFRAKIVDSGSGLDIGSLHGSIDDDAAIVSYDPDTGMVEARSRKPLQYGIHGIRLEAKDRVGNVATHAVGDLHIR